MAKEHYVTRMKREIRELHSENAELKKENEELKLAIPSSEVPDYIYVAFIDKESNWLCEHQGFSIGSDSTRHLRSPLADNEVDLIVEDQQDKTDGAMFGGGGEIQGDWNFVKNNFPDFWAERVKGRTLRTAYDPHGFIQQVGLTPQTLVSERLKIAYEEVTQKERYAHTGYWHVGFYNLDKVILNGRSFLEQWKEAIVSTNPLRVSELMSEARESICVEYENGKQHKERFNAFSVNGETGNPNDVSFSVVADKKQIVNVSFADETPDSSWIGNYMEYDDEKMDISHDTDPEGGRIEFK